MIYIIFTILRALLATELPEDGAIVAARVKPFRLVAETPRPVAEQPKLQRQPHIQYTGKTVSSVSFIEELKDPLEVFTTAGVENHPTLSRTSSYDQYELFRNDLFIGRNGKYQFLVDRRRKEGLFQGLSFNHWRLLLVFIADNKTGKHLLGGWDSHRIKSILKRLSTRDISDIAKSQDGCYFLGLVFRYLPRRKVIKAELTPWCLVDMFCMFAPAPHMYSQQFDLAWLAQRYPPDFLQKLAGTIFYKSGFYVDFKGGIPRLIGNTDVERFFIETGLIKDGKSPFTRETFQYHSSELFKTIDPKKLRTFVSWAIGLYGDKSDKPIDVPRTSAILGALTRTDINHLLVSEDTCKVIAPVLQFMDVYQLPLYIDDEKVRILMSHISWFRNAKTVISKLNPMWIEKQKHLIMPLIADHYPRSERMSKECIRETPLSVADAERHFSETGSILDGVEPFTPESFINRSKKLLLSASRRAIVNIARWMSLGDLERAKALAWTLDSEELEYFERKRVLHVFDEVFPLMDMESVAKADLLSDNITQLLGKINLPNSKYGLTWRVLEEFPRSFFANWSYASALIQVVCRRFEFHQFPKRVVSLLSEIYGRGVPVKHAYWSDFARDLILEEQSSRVEAVLDEIQTTIGAHSEIDKELAEKLRAVEQTKAEFLAECFELQLSSQPNGDKAREASKAYAEAVDGILTMYQFIVKLKQ